MKRRVGPKVKCGVLALLAAATLSGSPMARTYVQSWIERVLETELFR
jgi:hypothetical protein